MNVSLIEIINYIWDNIENTNDSTGTPADLYKELLMQCTYNIQFQFNNKIYRQKGGNVIGSPLEPIIVDSAKVMLKKQ